MSLSQHTSLDSLLAFIRPTTTISRSSISTPTAITRSIGLFKTGFVSTQHFFTNLTLKQIFFLILGTSSALYILSPTLVDCILYLTSDDDNSNKNNKSSKKMMLVKRKKKAGKYTVGLVNPANDCFANSNLQALASLRLLYGYISTLALAVPPDITDMKRADESPASSASSTISSPTLNDNSSRNTTRASVRSNPKGIENSPIGLTLALGKTVLALNEPVLVPKSLSPWPFLRVIEAFYNSHISRNQHDAHELLHLILESLEMEHERVSKFYTAQRQTQPANNDVVAVSPVPEFPFKGTTIDKITCSKCGYSPTTSSSTFIVFSLMVPQKKSAHLTDLLNEVSSPEHIKDYGCVKCRVNHVLSTAAATGQGRDLSIALAPYAEQRRLAELPDELEAQLPRNITSPISKSMQFGRLPAILAIHLSRSIYGGYGASRNSCKVTVVETIELWENVDETESAVKVSSSSEDGKKSSIEIAAALLGNRRKVTYRLVAMIRHKGTHHAGHYECFRRKNLDWWIDNLPKSKPASSASSVSTTNNSTGCTSRRNSASNGIDSSAKAEKNLTRKTVTGLASVSPEPADENQDLKSESVVNTSSQLGSRITNAAAAPTTASPTPAVITVNPADKFPPQTCKGESSRLAASVKPVTLSKEDYGDEENHGKLPFPQANRTTPLATSKIDVITDKKQLTYSSSSSSVVSLVAQAQQQQQQQQHQQPLLTQQQNQPYRSSQQGTAVITRHFGPDVAPPSQYEWWKISDEKTWECSTRDVLKEESGAYLLFYERI